MTTKDITPCAHETLWDESGDGVFVLCEDCGDEVEVERDIEFYVDDFTGKIARR
jgi:hypothetical protein